MREASYSITNLAFSIGLLFALIGTLSHFSPFLTSGFGLLLGDPRLAMSGLIVAGLVVASVSLWLHVKWPQSAHWPYWQPRFFVLALALSGLYFNSMFITRPYYWQEAQFSNGTVELAGTLFVPAHTGPHPAIILMRGCCNIGDQSRWGSFALANLLAQQGIATLFYDARGYGGSTGYPHVEASFQELAEDTVAASKYLAARPEIDGEQIGLFGISHSSMIAPLAASLVDNVAFLIIVSGGGYTGYDEFVFDLRVALEDAGFTDSDIEGLLPEAVNLREQINDYYRTGAGYDEVTAALQEASEAAWFKAQTILPGPDQVCPYGSRCATNHVSNWDYDPVLLLESLDVPMLFLYGPDDRIVPAVQSANRLRDTFAEKTTGDIEIVIIEGAGHTMLESWPVFAPLCNCKPVSVEDSSLLSVMTGFIPRYIPEFENAMTSWLSERVRLTHP